MKFRGEYAVVLLGLAFLLATACTAAAGMGRVMDRQATQGATGEVFYGDGNLHIIPVVAWSEPSGETPLCDEGASNSQYHARKVNRVGDNEPPAKTLAGSSTRREADFQLHQWVPETYGLMGDYSRDSR